VQNFVWPQDLEVSTINIFYYIHTEWFLKKIHLHLLAIKILKAFWKVFTTSLHIFTYFSKSGTKSVWVLFINEDMLLNCMMLSVGNCCWKCFSLPWKALTAFSKSLACRYQTSHGPHLAHGLCCVPLVYSIFCLAIWRMWSIRTWKAWHYFCGFSVTALCNTVNILWYLDLNCLSRDVSLFWSTCVKIFSVW